MVNQDTYNQYLAVGKHVVTFGSGFITAIGVGAIGGLSPDDIQTSFGHIFNGLKEIGVGLGPLAGAAMAWWAQNKAKLSSKVADVKAADPHQLISAVQQVSPVTLRDAVAAQPEVTQVVVTSPVAAAASPSPKVTTEKV